MTYEVLKLILEISGSVSAVAMVGSLMFAWANGNLERLARDHTKNFHWNQEDK